MSEVTALFWDVGGVVLSNGWDHDAREEGARRFGLDRRDFEDRHRQVEEAFETGRLTLDAYLQRTVFYCPRSFTREVFIEFMFGQSSEKSETRAILDELSASRQYLLATINNEAAELNTYRIRRFDLKRNFAAFFTSCYLRVRKPDQAIYQMALEITQRAPEETIFIDDRAANLEPARRLGMRVILFQDAVQLRAGLAQFGVHGSSAAGSRADGGYQ
jgi:putative hydrolase of the HAD superfamily